MKAVFPLLVVALFIACERKPTVEELETQRLVEAAKAKDKATPKPGDWMFKGYKNPLDPPKH